MIVQPAGELGLLELGCNVLVGHLTLSSFDQVGFFCFGPSAATSSRGSFAVFLSTRG